MTTEGKNTVQVTFKIQHEGFGADLTAECLIEHIPGIVKKLRDAGIEPALTPYAGTAMGLSSPAGAHGNGAAAGAPVCPRHNQTMKEGKFGWMCPSKTDNPEWANQRGYCNYQPD